MNGKKIGLVLCCLLFLSVVKTNDNAALEASVAGSTSIIQALATKYSYDTFFSFLKKTAWWQKLTPYGKPTEQYTVFAIEDSAFARFNKMNLLDIKGDAAQTQQNYNDFIGYLILEGDYPLSTLLGKDDLFPHTVSGRPVSADDIKNAVFEIVVTGFGRVIVFSKMVINPVLTERYVSFVDKK